VSIHTESFIPPGASKADKPRDNYQELLTSRDHGGMSGTVLQNAMTNPTIRAKMEEQQRLEQAVRDSLLSLESAKSSVIQAAESIPSAVAMARGIAIALDNEAALAAGVRILNYEILASVGFNAVDKLRDWLLDLAQNLDKRLEPVHAAVAADRQAERARELAAQEAEEHRRAKAMSDAQVLAWLETECNAILRLNDDGLIEIAPDRLAQEMRARAMIRLHYSGLKALLKDRQTFAVVEPVK
jgi:hypothetical protein